MPHSPFFQTLHDGSRSADRLGGRTHYSVLRVPIWHDEWLNPVTQASLLDFAIIWDEDHDVRVMDAVEEMYFAGLLSPVRFIGERNGRLAVLLAARTIEAWTEGTLRDYKAAVDRISQGMAEPWASTVDEMFGREHSIMDGLPREVDAHLDDIQLTWQLGRKASLVHLKRARQIRVEQLRTAGKLTFE